MADKFTVLLIDDEVELVTALAERLAYRDIRADMATAGAQALEMMARTRYDVVVLDLKLPGISGAAVWREIRRAYPDVPVVLITGYGAPNDLPEFKSDGTVDYLPKPIDLNILIETMQKAVGRT